MDGKVEPVLFNMFSGIDAIIADLFEMFFRDRPDEPLDEFHSGQGLFYVSIIFMAVVMERDSLSVITVNTGGCNHRPSKISADIFRRTLSRLLGILYQNQV